MNCIQTSLPGVVIFTPQLFSDLRGWFMETYSQKIFSEQDIDAVFVQENHSFSEKKGTLRGLHFQNSPHAQSKLVRCTAGSILDVAVDLRKGSPDFCKWVSVELSAENKLQLYIPKGFAHGFVTHSDNTEVQYKVDDYYAPGLDRSVCYNDPQFGIQWGVERPILSEKDKNAPFFMDSDSNFIYERCKL